ncbi:MAG: putative hydrolase of the HAD superfamily [Natronomonas sp.]|jgi:putative hydrolase of the HAD superfamily
MNAIFFDLDGTLVHTPDFEALLRETFREVRGEARDEWLETYSEAFFESFWSCEPEPYRRGFEAVGEDAEALAERFQRREIESCQPTANAKDDLERLAEEYRLGVLTNGVPEVQRAKLDTSGLAAFFETVVSSYELGAHKPDPKPFRTAEERLSADAYAMVGDSDDDVEGAEGVGWTAHRYDGGGFGDLPDTLDW